MLCAIYERLDALVVIAGGEPSKTDFPALGDYWLEETLEADIALLKREAKAWKF